MDIKNENTSVEETVVKEVEETSTIKQMRATIKEKDAKLKEFEDNAKKVEELNKTVEELSKKDLINTYGEENLEEAQKLKEAGFDTNRIKEMLKITDVKDFVNNDEELGLVKEGEEGSKPQIEEPTLEDEEKELQEYRDKLSKIDR